MLYEDITRRIIGCAIEVHKQLGNGFQEVIYQRALEIEMRLDGLSFEREMEMSHGSIPNGDRIADKLWK